MKQKKIKGVQEWNPVVKIFDSGIILLKNQSFIKILKVISINFSLKTDFEKETILNSYKILLKTCNFPFQIVIQSTKEDLSKQEKEIQQKNEEEKENIKKYAENYLNYLRKLNNLKKSSRKNFYIILKSDRKPIEMRRG